MLINDDIAIIRSKSKNRCRIFVIESEEFLNHETLHEFLPEDRKFAIDAFLTELCLIYELPLRGHITSSTPYDYVIKKPSKTVVERNDEFIFLNCSNIQVDFPFFVCNFYTNSTPVMLDEAQQWCEVDDTLIDTVLRLINLISVERPTYNISHVEKCVLNKYNLLHS